MPSSPPTAAASGPPDATRLLESTGVPGLDLVLGGGLPRGALTIILGPPGSGKTTLACQIAFAAAGRGQQALLLTALSESPTKLLEHLGNYRFFEPGFLAERIQVYNAQQFFPPGEATPIQQIAANVRKTGASWVIIDGFRGLREVEPDSQRARQLLYSLGTRLSFLGTTTLLTSEGDPRSPALFPEMTTADVLIGLFFPLVGVQVHRGLEILKVRGQAPLLGRHSLALSEQGVEVFPRLETRITGPLPRLSPSTVPRSTPALGRAAFELPELDALLGGGLTRQTSTVLAGSLGTGKTLLASSFALAGLRREEPVLWLSFRETAEQLVEKVDPFGLGTTFREALAPGGRLRMQRWEPVELNPDQVVNELLRALAQLGAQRLIIDSIAELERAVIESSGAERVPNFFAAFLAALRRAGGTVVVIKETPKAIATEIDFSTEPLGVLAENVLLLQQLVWQGQIHRVLSVLKMGFSAHDATLREVRIAAPAGFEVLTPLESMPALVAELSRQQETPGAGERSPSPGKPASSKRRLPARGTP
jgi:circadian clock protein KaiC